MAFETVIYLATPSAGEKIIELLTVHFAFTKSFDEEFQVWRVFAEGITVAIRAASALEKDLIHEKLEIDVQISLRCRIDKFDFYRSGMDNLVRLIVGFLRHLDCDMVVLLNCEKPLVLRKNGTIFLDLQAEYWQKALLPKFAEEQLPFVQKTMNVL